MVRKRLRAVMLVMLSVLTLTGLSGGQAVLAQAEKPKMQDIRWGACPPEIPAGMPRFQCGTIQVPLDYKRPNGKQITVAVSKLSAADPHQRRGSLFLNPGGPGGTGLDMPLWMSMLMPQSILNQYDLIGFDPRFVGQSTPITCGLSFKEAQEVAPPLEQPGGFDNTVRVMRKAAQGCDRNAGAKLAYATTANTARDMDMIRGALGDAKLSYFGYSYGTYLGGVYAGLYPGNADRIILDSATNPRGAWRDMFRSWGPGGEQRFPDFAQFAADTNDFYHLGATQEEVRATYFRLMDKLKSNPLTIDGMELNDAWFRVLTFGALYNDMNLPFLAAFWQLVNEDAPVAAMSQPLTKLMSARHEPASSVPADNSSASALAILCGDVKWSTSVSQYKQEFNADKRQFPLFGALGSNIWPCAFWQTEPAELPVRIDGNGPANNILVLQNLRDPATPYWNGAEMRSALGKRARLITVDQGGHGAAFIGFNNCADDAATGFLTKGTFPSADKYCPSDMDRNQIRSLLSPDRERAISKIYQKIVW